MTSFARTEAPVDVQERETSATFFADFEASAGGNSAKKDIKISLPIEKKKATVVSSSTSSSSESSSSESSDSDEEDIIANAIENAMKSEDLLPAGGGVPYHDALGSSGGATYEEVFQGELDVIWETDWQGKLVRIKCFRKIEGKAGPAQEGGKLAVGHILVGINNANTPEDFQDTVLMLKRLAKDEEVPYKLKFYASDGVVASREEIAMRVVMNEIHLHKTRLYQAQGIGMTKGFVERYKGDYMTTFHLHRESDNSFVCGASCKNDMSGDFIFHTLVDMTWDAKFESIPTDPSAHCYLGRMVKNFTGTRFTVHDYRVKDPKTASRQSDKPGERNRVGGEIHELGTILYQTNITGGDPNAFTAIIPRFDEEYLEQPQKTSLLKRYNDSLKTRSSTEQSSLLAKLRKKPDRPSYNSVEQQEQAELLVLKTQKAEWDEKLGAWTLDFDGRVKLPSKRNFIVSVDSGNRRLVDEFGKSTTLLRHGKVAEDRHVLDYRDPLSPVQALAVVLTSFSEKLLVT